MDKFYILLVLTSQVFVSMPAYPKLVVADRHIGLYETEWDKQHE